MSPALYRGFVGGRGSGKSWVGAYDLIRRAKRDRTYLVGSPTGVMMGDTTFPTFKAIARDLGVWNPDAVKLNPYPTVTLTTGATIRFRTAENPEKMRGPNLSGAWLDEASLMEEDAYQIAIACLREAGEQGWLSATFTPKGLTHWTYERFGRTPPAPNTELFHCRTLDNPFLPAQFAATLAEQYVGQFASQELGGLFVAMEGAEWPSEWFDGILFDDWPADVGAFTRVMALDPSRGKADKSGDYSAWIMLGIDATQTPEMLWVDADMSNTRHVNASKDSPGHSIVGDGYDLMLKWMPVAVLIETNGFQQLVAEDFAQHCAQRQMLSVPIFTRDSTEPKQQRIRSLGPYFARRRIRIRNTPGGRLLVKQLRDFPNGDHDDGPDALKLAEIMADFILHGDGAFMAGKAPKPMG